MNYKEFIDYLEAQAVAVNGIESSQVGMRSDKNNQNIDYPNVLILQPKSSRTFRQPQRTYNVTFFIEDVYQQSEKVATNIQTKLQQLEELAADYIIALTDNSNGYVLADATINITPYENWADNNLVAIEFTTSIQVTEC